jgi:hypothetical protein
MTDVFHKKLLSGFHTDHKNLHLVSTRQQGDITVEAVRTFLVRTQYKINSADQSVPWARTRFITGTESRLEIEVDEVHFNLYCAYDAINYFVRRFLELVG